MSQSLGCLCAGGGDRKAHKDRSRMDKHETRRWMGFEALGWV